MTHIHAFWLAMLLAPLGSVPLIAAVPGPDVTIQAAPEHPIVEMRGTFKSVNFDMMVRNDSKLTLRIAKIEISAYDAANSLIAGPVDEKDWGLPAYFTHFHRWMAGGATPVARGPVNSGDFVESDAAGP